MTECLRCEGKAHNAYLCPRCTSDLRKMLSDMPWWLNRLTETALGHTRMSDNAGRKSATRRDLDGDLELAACIEPLPAGEEDLEKARKAREKLALAHALATGGINAKASELLSEIADSLGYWARVLCESRGLPAPAPSPGSALGTPLAAWLAVNVHAIALSEDADTIALEIEQHLDDIKRTVNRPIKYWYLGQCETFDEQRDKSCGTHLRVPEGTYEMYCPRCHVNYSVHRLFLARMHERESRLMPFSELAKFNRQLPQEYQIAPRTLQHWRASGILRPQIVAEEPLYSWEDVKRLQLRKPQKMATGAAAHRGS